MQTKWFRNCPDPSDPILKRSRGERTTAPYLKNWGPGGCQDWKPMDSWAPNARLRHTRCNY